MPNEWEEKRNQQNSWFKQQFRVWQAAWHDAFDQDQLLKVNAEVERRFPLPEDIDVDHRLIYEFCHVLPETRRACFSMFPNGAEMYRRLEDYLASPSTQLTEKEARKLVRDIEHSALEARPNEQVDWSKIIVIDPAACNTDDALPDVQRISYLFEQNLWEPTPDEQLQAVGAQLFLNEPLYAAAGNTFHLRDWVTAAMFDPNLDRVYEVNHRLRCAGWGLHYADGQLFLIRDDA
ncbi:hypothetical protein [Agrobacterium sp. lyk4-40-TYG-31]|uniref:hypothetical protein n=1 Tax=Agrobacterium sp. lyk4-40-TYG-31 TaxID=3040276 RepID=UPI002551120B|nr:hypothetical protein [Agrobacterium sp. lyk4-40-TYG-31]